MLSLSAMLRPFSLSWLLLVAAPVTGQQLAGAQGIFIFTDGVNTLLRGDCVVGNITGLTPTGSPIPLSTTVQLQPGFHYLSVNLATGMTPDPTSNGGAMSINVSLDFSTGVPAGATGSVTFLGQYSGGNPVVFAPLAIPANETLFGAAPDSLSSSSVQIGSSGNAVTVLGNVLAGASGNVTAFALAMFDLQFDVTQATTLTISGSLDGSLQGATQTFPLLPTSTGTTGQASFVNCPTGQWVDPPLALGFDFQQTGSSLFTHILALPVGIDGDGLFEVFVGSQSLGQFAAGAGVDFVQLHGSAVASFRIVGIDPAVDATNNLAFPVKLAFDTPTADFTMTPVTWRNVGAACSEAVCLQCPATTLQPVGDALEGNLNFALAISNAEAGSLAGIFVGLGTASAPAPLWCGSFLVPLQNAWFTLGIVSLQGTSGCDGAGSIAAPLVPTPSLFGLFLTVQAATLCPAGGFGLTPALEFPVGN